MGRISESLRFKVLNRDGFCCCYCGAPAGEVRIEVDHVIPRAWGGKDVLENLRTSCVTCNRGKGAAVAVPPRERKNARPAEEGWPDRFIWLSWGNWHLELSPTDSSWCFLIYRPDWLPNLPESAEYWIDRERFGEQWIPHIAQKAEADVALPEAYQKHRRWNPGAAIELRHAFEDLRHLGLVS